MVNRLASRYPYHPRQEIEAVVNRHWQTYAGATIRFFIPILVTRRAATERSPN